MGWDQLVIEHGASPPFLGDDQFRSWMTERRIFVSSTMDDEMMPVRAAVRDRIRHWNGVPEMWEALAPRDQHPEQAYLEGVDRSQIFALIVGHRYGVEDDNGYSPIHKENNRAVDRHIPRLLFELSGISRSARDGKLNDWMASLHRQISGSSYTTPEDVAEQLENRLRELASTQETPWIKIGNLVFPGKVRRHSTGGITQAFVTARIRNQGLRDAVADLGNWQRSRGGEQLTFGTNSWTAESVDLSIESSTLSSDDVTITCRLAQGRSNSMAMAFGGVTHHVGGRSIGPADQAQMWMQRSVFGQQPPDYGDRFLQGLLEQGAQPLPRILSTYRAQGWLAEGLVRLYLIEELSSKFGAQIQHLDVGSATASGVRVDGSFRLPGYDQSPIPFTGTVPLSG